MDLQNKAAIVTDGIRGIGLAVVEAFLREGRMGSVRKVWIRNKRYV